MESEKQKGIAANKIFGDDNSALSFSDAVYELLKSNTDTDTSEKHTVCFVCTGNTCRSPMAAAVFNHMVKKNIVKKLIPEKSDSDFDRDESTYSPELTTEKENFDMPSERLSMHEFKRGEAKSTIKAVSAGIMPNIGEKISSGAVNALTAAGIESYPDNNWEDHTATALDRSIMENCDLIVGISSHHAMAVLAMYPEYASKVISMPQDINDPYGADDEEYMKCLSEITDGLKELFT